MVENARFLRISGHDMPTFSSKLSQLLRDGRVSFTKEFALENGLGPSNRAVVAACQRAIARGELLHPRRGFYLIIPHQFRHTDQLPAELVIDDLMSFEGAPYYVSMAKAAEIHGASTGVICDCELFRQSDCRGFRCPGHR